MAISSDTIAIGSAGCMLLCILVFITTLIPEFCNDWFNGLSFIGKSIIYGILLLIFVASYMSYRHACNKAAEELNDNK